MKVKLPVYYRDAFTLSDMDVARRIIKEEKDDLCSVKEYAKDACNHILANRIKNDFLCEILSAEAIVCRNSRVWDRYGEGTNNFDISIQGIAETHYGFIKFSALLSDIWSITGDNDFTTDWYIRYFTEEKQ